jgi:hypothetical protein
MFVQPEGAANSTLNDAFGITIGMQVDFVVVAMAADGTLHEALLYVYGNK